MYAEIITIICITVISIIMIGCIIATILYDKLNHKRIIHTGENENNDWLFSNLQETVFDIFFKNPKSDVLCGISQTEYIRYCQVLHLVPNIKNMVAYRIEAVVISLTLGIIACIVSYSITAIAIGCILIVITVYLLWILPYATFKAKAENRLYHIEDDLPRFLSLLEKAMDLPIDQAMKVTATKFKSPLSEDIMDSLNKVALGANGWTETLVNLAKIYKIEAFSDLILEIVNSYEQGVNVRSLVIRKAKEVEQNRLYAVESHDSQIKTLIFLPIIVFKVLPLMALICLPMIKDFI